MIDIAPPPENLPKKIPPRELIRQKIAESELGMDEGREPKMRQMGPTAPKIVTPSMQKPAKPIAPKPEKPKGRTGIGMILVLLFTLFLSLAAIAAVGFVYWQSLSSSAKIKTLEESVRTGPADFQTQKSNLEKLQNDFTDLKKAEADKLDALEDKINKLSPSGNSADKATVEKLQKILKITDSDKDGLTDYEEVITYGSNPNIKDTDADGHSDKTEVDNGYNPAGPGKLTKKEETTATTSAKVTQVKLYKYAFDPAEITVSEGDVVNLELTSLDTEHTFTIDELSVNQTVTAGATKNLEFIAETSGEYTYYSNILEDKGKGMAGKLIVK